MTNFLVQSLRENNAKSDAFTADSSVTSYKTGFPVLDYYLGYLVNVYDENDKLVDQYPSLGIADGSFVTFIGKPSTGKTTMAVQVAANIVRPFENGFVIHYDLEQGQNYSRIQNLTHFKMTDILDNGKYILKQGRNSLDEIKSAVTKIWKEKIDNPDKYKYDTGKLNEFGKPVKIYVPTVVIIDSIAVLTKRLNENDKKDLEAFEDISSQTERMRLTAEIGRFYTELTSICKEANIILISINQIKVNPGMGIVKAPSEILYLDQNEALPGGKSPQFLSNVLIKFVAVGSEKFNYDDNGFDGFGVQLKIIKSRTNQAGQIVHLMYDKLRGMDGLRSSLAYAKDLGFLGGNKNGMYFAENKDMKWTNLTVHQDFKDNKELYTLLYDSIIPVLRSRLSCITPEEMNTPEEEINY